MWKLGDQFKAHTARRLPFCTPFESRCVDLLVPLCSTS